MKNSLIACVILFGASVAAMAQCGPVTTVSPVTCCDGSLVRVQGCVGFGGDFCQSATGNIIFPCHDHGCAYLEPGDCLSGKATSPDGLFNHPSEWLARADAKTFHDAVFGDGRKVNFVSCSADKSQFNNWLEAQLREQKHT